MATNVKGEKRFLSTIARRLDTMGAITKGQRQTGGQGLFRADDNLESAYARDALRQFYGLLHAGKVTCCTLANFQDATGLQLTDADGSLREELPPITTFLNRMLALRIEAQNSLFDVFEQLLTARVEGAIAAGVYDRGLETLAADSLVVTERRTVYTHPATGAETRIFTLARRDRNRPLTLDQALTRAEAGTARLLVNHRSGRAAVEVPAPGLMLDDGSIERRVRLLRPMEQQAFAKAALADTLWEETGRDAFAKAWEDEIAGLPEFTDSTFHVVTGLLLPIWRRLPDENCRVYRLQTDDGERVVGRLVSPTSLGALCRNLGLDDVPAVSPDEAWQILIHGKGIVQLADGLQLRRVRVMNDYRVELTGFTAGMRDRLTAMGLMHEIISWKLRFFVPVGAGGPAIVGRLMARHPLTGIADRAAA